MISLYRNFIHSYIQLWISYMYLLYNSLLLEKADLIHVNGVGGAPM